MRKVVEGKKAIAIPVRRILYCICFCMFRVIDQRIRTAYGKNGWLETFRDLTGTVMAVLILSHYKFSDFRKWKSPYLLWTVTGIIAGVPAFLWGMQNERAMNDWAVILLDIFLFGYIIIHIVTDFVVEKKKIKIEREMHIWVFPSLSLKPSFYLLFSMFSSNSLYFVHVQHIYRHP